MKYFKFIILITLLSACQNTLLFEEAQPLDGKTLKAFPKNLIGTYQVISAEDMQSQFIISKNSVVKLYTISDTLSLNDYQDELKITNDQLIALENNQQLAFKRINDTLIYDIVFPDTLFVISDNHQLKSKNKAFYLNKFEAEKNAFSVTKIMVKGHEVLEYGTDKSSLEVWMSVKNQPADTANKIIKPTTKEFKTFEDKGGFVMKNKYKKIK